MKKTTEKKKSAPISVFSMFILPMSLSEKLRQESHKTRRSRSDIVREVLEERYRTEKNGTK